MQGERLLKKAIQIANEAHKNQVDKFGASYLGHITRVMNRGTTIDEKIVGVLHDVVEDTDWTFEKLEQEGFPPHIIDALRCVTKTNEEENYEDFIERIKVNPLAVKVKLNDLRDNMDITRMPAVTEKDLPRLNKYLKAYKALGGHELQSSFLSSINLQTNRSKEPDWKKIEEGLNKYKYIMQRFKEVNVENDKDFQKRFNGFYRLRQKSEIFYQTFYRKLESSKGTNITFEEVLRYFFKELNASLPSFSSKLVATLNPLLPVWDSVVLEHFKLKPPANNRERLQKILMVYKEIEKRYAELLASVEGEEMISEFNKRFPSSGVTDLKKLDLIIWQTR